MIRINLLQMSSIPLIGGDITQITVEIKRLHGEGGGMVTLAKTTLRENK